MATIRDVAKLAGVSISTVSLAFNEPGRVNQDTRQRIEDAARATGFTANPIARSLKRGTSQLIAMVVSDITNPFFARLLSEMERHADEEGYLVVVNDSGADEERERRILSHLAGQRVAGLIISPTGRTSFGTETFQSLPMPFVMFDHRLSGIECDYVGTDNVLASAMLTEHLVRLGHRRIALIGGTQGVFTAERRREGYEDVLRASGIAVDPSLVLDGRYNGAGGYEAAMRLMTRPELRPTAIVAASNVMAAGTLQAMRELGISCPDQISLAAIDDLPWPDLIRPRMTVALQSVDEMARAAIGFLMERIAAKDSAAIPHRIAIFPPRLTVRDSTAPPPG